MVFQSGAVSGFITMEFEVFITVLVIGGWGGFVSFLMRKRENMSTSSFFTECLAQIVISCFTGFILSIIAIEYGYSSNLVMVCAGIGGVFSSPLLRLLGEKMKKTLGNMSIIEK